MMENVHADVPIENRTKLEHLMNKYSDIFSMSEFDLGETPLGIHRIDTGDARPVCQTLRRQPYDIVPKIDAYVEDMCKAGIIEPSSSPWSSNLVVVKKKDGSYRYCVDCCKLNSLTRRDAYPLPRNRRLLGHPFWIHWFSIFDLKASYHQVPMHPNDADKTSFVTRTGTYRFKRVPSGLCNAGSTFQRVMDLPVCGMNFDLCLVYLDDIVVFSKTLDEHLRRLELLFDRLRLANLKLKPSKCYLMQTEISFLVSHVISKDGVSTDPAQIETVKEWPIPTFLTEVRSFLRLASYFRRFVDSFAQKAIPLYRLAEKGRQFEWTED